MRHLEDAGTPGSIAVATPEAAGQADVIVITAGRGQRRGRARRAPGAVSDQVSV